MEAASGTRTSDGRKKGNKDLLVDVPMPIVKEGPNKKGVTKLWRRYNLHGIRETCRAIRVQSGSIEVEMVTNGKVQRALDNLALLRNLVEELKIYMEGNK